MVGQCVLLFADVYAWLTYVLVIKNVFFSPEGPWKKKNLAEFGIVTQCIAPQKVNDQYLTNVLLKINAKVSTLEKSYILVPLFIQRFLPEQHFLLFLYQFGGMIYLLVFCNSWVV